ncbi:MAG: flagellar hook protein FlgE [Chloroflexi bacterium]|nr:MAG: flagellar hook protein FlgE [Chloroflexota bacterium]
MLRSMNSAISGLKNHQTMMDVISNNIANVNTTGFKSSRVTFQTLLAQTIRGSIPGAIGSGGQDSIQIGLGMAISGVDKLNTQGVLSNTSKLTDMAISGDGYFIMTDGYRKFYSRDGAFDLDSTGALISPATGLRVNGWVAETNASGQKVINSAMPPSAPLTIPLGAGVNAKASSMVSFSGNLNGSSTDLVSSGVVESSTVASAISFATTATDALTFTYGGKTYNATISTALTKDASTIADLATAMATAINAALVAGGETDVIQVTASDSASVSAEGGLVFKAAKSLSFGSSPSSNLELGAALKGRASTGLESMTTSIVAYDTLGMAHELTVKFQKQVPTAGGAGPVFSNTWKWTVANLDAGTTLKADTAAGQAFGFVTFDSSGKFQSATTSTVAGATAPVTATDLTGSRVTLNFANGQSQGQQLLLDFTRMSQLQDGNTVSAVENDGHPTGTLTSFTVGSNGLITGSYSNGVQEALGQIALATFANPSGLSLVSQNLMSESANSGIPQVGVPGAGARGQINGGQLELSNVDLAVQFTDMIRAERGFQANSRIITTSDEMLQDLVNLKR